MRRMLWITAAAALVFSAAAVCAQDQQQSQSQSQQSQSDSQKAQQSSADKSQNQNSQSQATGQSAQPQDSLAAAAKKAREQKKDSAKPAKVFTNDDMPAGGISTIGADKSADSSAAGAQDAAAAAGPNDEKTWRTRFEKLHHKLDQDQQELDILQRELGVAATQFYGGDPNKAMNDQMSGQPNGAAYTKKVGDIDAKKKQVEADKQAISDAEEELRKAGGDPGWAR